MLYIVNFPFCNFNSLERYFIQRKLKYEILDSSTNTEKDSTIILPGVGTFGEGMNYLNKMGFTEKIKNHSLKGGKIFGICLGMQLLLEKSEESDNTKGLGLIGGNCKKISKVNNFRVPHIGWNSLIINSESKQSKVELIKQLNVINSDYYFVHSYYADLKNDENIIAYFPHPLFNLCASIQKDNILGVQFHPEKSGLPGYKLLDLLIN